MQMLLLILILFFLFVIFPICGVQALLEGEIGLGIFFLLPLMIALCVLVYKLLYDRPRKKQQEALHKMYNLPQDIYGEYGEVWGRKFQKVIAKAIKTTDDPEKLTDLKHCQRVVKEMSAYSLDSPFYEINNAFRLTGCHFIIKDSQGNTITQIV